MSSATQQPETSTTDSMERIRFRVTEQLDERVDEIIDAGLYNSAGSIVREGIREVARNPAREAAHSDAPVKECRYVCVTPEMLAVLRELDSEGVYASQSDVLRDATHRVVEHARDLQPLTATVEATR